jgi:hypothetical protein
MLVSPLRRVAHLGTVLALTASCSDDSTSPSLTIDPDAPAVHARASFDSVYVGRLGVMFAVATGDSAAVAWPRFQWSSADTTIARVDSSGKVLGIAPGQVWVRAALEGMVDSALVTVAVATVRGDVAVQRVATSGSRQCALLTGGVAACVNTIAGDSIPTLVPLEGASTVSLDKLSASTRHTCGLTSGGEMYCWGTNGIGEHMNGRTSAPALTPVRAGGSALYSSVSVGDSYTCATVRVTQLPVCAGDNFSRKLGRVTSGNSDSIPGPIAAGALATGRGSFLSNSNGSSMCLITEDYQLVCWGGSQTSLPAYVNGDQGMFGAARGLSHTCVVSTSGRITCTGANSVGELGNGTVATFETSTWVASSENFIAVTAARNYTCALNTDGALFCWGDFPNAALRAAYGERRRAPVPVLAGVQFSSINATPNTLCGVTTDQRYICL